MRFEANFKLLPYLADFRDKKPLGRKNRNNGSIKNAKQE